MKRGKKILYNIDETNNRYRDVEDTYLNLRFECFSSRDYCDINEWIPSMRYRVVNV